MKINPIVQFNIQNLGKNVSPPNEKRNYHKFDDEKIKKIVAEKEAALPYLEKVLNTSNKHDEILEALYILNYMLESNTKGIDKLYPAMSRFNYTKSPDIQVMLAGIYRKTLVPDGFGPLNRMLMQQINQPNSPYYDPTEEIGGAIYEYLRCKCAQNRYPSAK